MEEGPAVRVRVPPAQRRDARNLVERAVSRTRRLIPGVLAAIERLPRNSKLRRSLVVQASTMGWEAISRGDFDLLLLLYDPDAVYSTEMPPELRLPDGPRGGSFRGLEAIREYAATFHRSWGWVHFELRDVLFLSDRDRILALGVLHTRGLASGIESQTPMANLIDLKGGRVIHQKDYWDHADALRAAGLDPAGYPDLSPQRAEV